MHLLIENPRFRLFWIAGVFGDVSLIAYWTIHGWLALQVSGSPFWVGATAGVGGVAMFLFAPIGGAMIDRFPKKDLLRIATLLRGLLAAGLTALIFSDAIQMWQVIGYAFLSGMAASVRVPGMKTLVMDIAGRENLLAGSALRMASMTVVGVAIPLAIGPVADRIGLGWAYVVIAAGDALFVILLSFVNIPDPERTAADAPLSRRSPIRDLIDGAVYTFRNPIVRVTLGVILISEVFGWSVEPMLPVIARETLGLGASGLGMLFASASGGAAVAAFAISSVGDIRHKGRLMAVGMIAFGAFLLAFSLSRNFPLSLALFALTGAATALYETAADTIIQSGVDTRMRGRVLSFQAMMWGVSGASGFYTGAMATVFGAPLAVGIGAVIVTLAGVWLAARRAARLDGATQGRDGG